RRHGGRGGRRPGAATRVYGATSATGGAQGGDGRSVETSGTTWLDFQGRVDTRAPLGRTGSLLLDPTDITISSASTTGGTCLPIPTGCFTLSVIPLATANLSVQQLTA